MRLFRCQQSIHGEYDEEDLYELVLHVLKDVQGIDELDLEVSELREIRESVKDWMKS